MRARWRARRAFRDGQGNAPWVGQFPVMWRDGCERRTTGGVFASNLVPTQRHGGGWSAVADRELYARAAVFEGLNDLPPPTFNSQGGDRA